MNSKKLIEMARKWRKVAVLTKRISSAKNDAQLNSDACSTLIAERDHFIVYTSDAKRFMVPLSFLESTIFVELLKMSEDELGLPSNGPIVLPCDSVFMNKKLLFVIEAMAAKFKIEKFDGSNFSL
ncbi:auxin-responsive protein SAUR68-like [Asparagus officinalis]|uniref:auxin-responsive protein SAUR68-like n=1 Tax=Asparagus officinalis TaxID=4686 RepID=UPI00098E6176|nr:auxin-responsive protein SAUR68-like [Asparagus officinalis]